MRVDVLVIAGDVLLVREIDCCLLVLVLSFPPPTDFPVDPLSDIMIVLLESDWNQMGLRAPIAKI